MYLYIAILLLPVDRRMAAMLTRSHIESAIHRHAKPNESLPQTICRMARDGTIRPADRNKIRHAYSKCSRAIHGGNTRRKTIRRAIAVAKSITTQIQTGKQR